MASDGCSETKRSRAKHASERKHGTNAQGRGRKFSSEAALSKELEGHPYTGIAYFVLLGFLGGIRMVLSHM